MAAKQKRFWQTIVSLTRNIRPLRDAGCRVQAYSKRKISELKLTAGRSLQTVGARLSKEGLRIAKTSEEPQHPKHTPQAPSVGDTRKRHRRHISPESRYRGAWEEKRYRDELLPKCSKRWEWKNYRLPGTFTTVIFPPTSDNQAIKIVLDHNNSSFKIELDTNLLTILDYTNIPRSRASIQAKLKMKHGSAIYGKYLMPALKAGLIRMTIPERPKSIYQQYQLTQTGRDALILAREIAWKFGLDLELD